MNIIKTTCSRYDHVLIGVFLAWHSVVEDIKRRVGYGTIDMLDLPSSYNYE